MGEHLAVRLGDKRMAPPGKTLFQGDVVFDYPVVDNDHVARAVFMRVGVETGRLAVGRPAGVADARPAGRIVPADYFAQVRQLARVLDDLERALIVEDGDAGAVVAAV